MPSGADLLLVAVVSLSPLLLRAQVLAASAQPRATVSGAASDAASLCHGGFMSLYIPRAQFDDLPSSVYVLDEHGGYHQAVAVADRCHYVLGETETFTVLTVASHGCFVKTKNYRSYLTVVVVALEDGGRIEVVESMRLVCERETKGGDSEFTPDAAAFAPSSTFPPEVSESDRPLASSRTSCGEDGFDITVRRGDAFPPLDLDAVWIPSSRGRCGARRRSRNAVTFTFPFTHCGARSTVAGGVMTFRVDVEAKRRPPRGSIFRDAPFRLTVACSFALAQTTHLDVGVKGEEPPSTLRSEGRLRVEMRFAKDDSYESFSSSHGPPPLAELGQPVYVEVFVVKHQDPGLTLLLDDCWATPTEDPDDLQRWKLLVKGCPFSGDSHATVVLPVVSSRALTLPSLRKRFVVKMFSFVKPAGFGNLVYFHCDVEICKGPGCSQSCSHGRRKLRRITARLGQRILYSVVSGGPLIYSK